MCVSVAPLSSQAHSGCNTAKPDISVLSEDYLEALAGRQDKEIEEGIHEHKASAFEQGGDGGTMRYRGKLYIPDVDGLRERIMSDDHNSRMWQDNLIAEKLNTNKLVLSSSSLSLATTKNILELQYKETYETTLRDDGLASGKLSIDRLRVTVEKCWMMVETGNPQFVMACSVTFSTSGIICVLASLILMEALIRIYDTPPSFPNSSAYHWTTSLILVVQSIGVVMGTVAPALRWFIFISFKRSNNASNANANFSKVEYYWIHKLVEWKERPLSLNISGTKFRKYLQGTRNLFLSFCIRTQILVVSMSKFMRFVSVVSFNLMFSCQLQGPNYHQSEPELGKDSKYHCYVLLLEGEEEMPEIIFKNISGAANQLVDTGRKRQPKHLINLLRKSSHFSGVADIYCDQVPALHSVEPSNCWTISVVTLTSIVVALPKVRNQMAHQLIRSVHGGLKYASFVEETMYPEDRFTNIRNAAYTVWEELEFHRKWLDEDL
ncbi:uncharacterized protein LOC132637122 [Lycium barbarum]|uniref:uncharacterized protein LOC132637122 n=1 Tax=Lycium barbarum TaxID=112863 RepID=UPI00293E5DA4|nr:uncharacterized protein LOC132637122 [Lycium barbarum]